jgi:hypothetical protein
MALVDFAKSITLTALEKMNIAIFRTPECSCPKCGHVITAATNTREDCAPSAGDLSVCLECGTLLKFSESLHIQALSDKELSRLFLEERGVYLELMYVQRQVQLSKNKQ